MKAYLIDPAERSVREVETTGELDSLYELLGCDLVDAVRLDDCDVWIDDEGLFKPEPRFFSFTDPNVPPLAGRGLVLGVDDEGNCTEPKPSLDEIAKRVMFVTQLGHGVFVMEAAQ
jgi:hypothetical protein